MKMKNHSLAPLLFIMGFMFAVFSACSSSTELPPVTKIATNEHHPGKFVWHNLITSDLKLAKKFYGELFGWQFEDHASAKAPYSVASLGSLPVAGLFELPDSRSDVKSQWIGLVSVQDVDQVSKIFADNGGKIVAKPANIPNHGRVALVVDPQGAAIGLIRTASGDPADNRTTPPVHSWLWDELWTTDPGQAAFFYRDIVGYGLTETKSDDIPYWIFQSGSRERAGMLRNPSTNTPPAWIPYVRVADARAAIDKAKSLGATVVLAPTDQVRKGTVGIIMDPTGAVITLQEWNR